MTATLRLTQMGSSGLAAIEVAFEEPGQARQAVTVPFTFDLPAEDRESLRWYYEDYLQFPEEPAPQIAARVQARMATLGKELFLAIFEQDDPRDLWAQIRHRLADVRVEVVTDVSSRAAVPWELLWDPKTDVPVAIRASTFVRAFTNPAHRPRLPTSEPEQVRVLLAICRPGGSEDVPFRSVASRLIKSLGSRGRDDFHLDVLRPPTFGRLAEVLRIAAEDSPYHIVHFDGHGVYERHAERSARGFVLFENPSSESGRELVDGTQLGSLLAETGVPIFVLNACRSARSEPAEGPTENTVDAHARVRAYGSLAAEVMDAGVAGVVAMDYNVYVVTAAQFIGDLYATLARGQTLGRAVSLGRKQLHAEPRRDVIGTDVELRDWPVPVVYEAAPVSLFRTSTDDPLATLTLDAAAATPSPGRGTVDEELPAAPDAGFFGRDETILALDRALDTDQIVLLHGYAGSGKTTTAAEFARWYSLTGGIAGPILFTSFEHYTPLSRVLDGFQRIFGPALAQRGLDWLTLSEPARRHVALDVLRRVPALWIWDNVETVRGVGDTSSALTEEEQGELLRFLRELRETRARVLLTSRRQERDWLGDLATPVAVPPMPMHERLQLAGAIAARRGRPILKLAGWRSLLRFTRGNPLTITVVVGEALRQGLERERDLVQFVEDLRKGEAQVEDNPLEGKAKSLTASLTYGFHEAFDERDQKRLALLHLFQGAVSASILVDMGARLETVLDLPPITYEEVTLLLDRAADIGHLSRILPGTYIIHPALPSYFLALFREEYPAQAAADVTRAYCQAIAGYALYFGEEYSKARTNIIQALALHEHNLLYARQLARGQGWDDVVIGTMKGLRGLYGHKGRWVEWSRLLDEIVPDYVDDNDEPFPGREEEWADVLEFRVRTAFERSDTAEALRLQRLLVNRELKMAEAALTKADEELDNKDRFLIRRAAVALHELGLAQAEQKSVQAIATLEQSLALAGRSNQSEVAKFGYNLAIAHLTIPEALNLDRASELLTQALAATPEDAKMDQSVLHAELGFVHLKLSELAAGQGRDEEAVDELIAGIEEYETALELTPADAEKSLAAKHSNLGPLYLRAGMTDRALYHLQKGIHYAERTQDRVVAATCRYWIAWTLQGTQRAEDALLFAERAQADLEPSGDDAPYVRGLLERLIAELRSELGLGG